MQVQRQVSKVRTIFGAVTLGSVIIGLLGLGVLAIMGIQNKQWYFQSILVCAGILAFGIVMVKIYSVIYDRD